MLKSNAIEEVFGSKGRIKILKLLINLSEMNISGIVRHTGLNHSVAISHLKILEKVGLIREKRFGRIRIFMFEEGGELAQAVKSLFNTWNREHVQ